MKIAIFGTGYVGLVTGACLAEVGNHVLCIDIDADKISALNQGKVPIYEPGLEAIVTDAVQNGGLEFTTDACRGVEMAEVIILAVGTPGDNNGSADLRHVLAVADTIAELMDSYKLVVIKSTVPVGSTYRVKEQIQNMLRQRGQEIPFSVASNPEFLKEGAAIEDFMKPDRVILGTEDNDAKVLLHRIYAPFNRNHDRIIDMDIRSAEMTKYVANAMLATKISFINEMAGLAEKLDADIESVRIGIGADPRIGYSFIYPGCGFGGSCFPKDVRALQNTAKQHGFDTRVLAAVEAVNDQQKGILVDKLLTHFNGELSGKLIAIWGLSFKPNTDDVREASSLRIMDALISHGAIIRGFDPVAGKVAAGIYADEPLVEIEFTDQYATLRDADAMLLITEWLVFRNPDWMKIREYMRGDLILDGRNIYNPEEVRAAGFIYRGIGRR